MRLNGSTSSAIVWYAGNLFKALAIVTTESIIASGQVVAIQRISRTTCRNRYASRMHLYRGERSMDFFLEAHSSARVMERGTLPSFRNFHCETGVTSATLRRKEIRN